MTAPQYKTGLSPEGLCIDRRPGMSLRVAWSYLALGVALTAVAWWLSSRQGNSDLPFLAFVIWITVGAVGLLQEIAHALIANLLGGKPRLVCLSAIGGAGEYKIWPGLPHLLTAAAGPMASFAIAIALASWFLPAQESLTWRLYDLIIPPELDGRPTGASIASVAVWVASVLTCLQLLPLSRCDGRGMLDGLIAIVRPSVGIDRRSQLASQIVLGLALATLLGAIAIAISGGPFQAAAWPLVLLLAVGLALSAQRGDSRSQLAEDERLRIGWLAWWKLRNAQAREHQEAVDVSKLDDILARLHEHGIESLTTVERSVLDRVSDRLKRRKEQTVEDGEN